MSRLSVSIIVPTRNEAENLPLLVPRIASAMGGRDYEVIVVDDASADGTPQVCDALSRNYPLRLLVRTEPRDGLSGAVLHGTTAARGEYLLVMDADLQHPPEQIPDLLAPLERNEAEFVIGSRYVDGGSTGEQWTPFRRINSSVATMLAAPFAGQARDPMSGFFALRRRTFRRGKELTPLGYKIGLELLCKCGVKRVREVPIHFGARAAGASKMTPREQFRYVEHLSRLYDFRFPRAAPIIKFLIATACGWAAALAAWVLLRHGGMASIPAAVLAYPASVLVIAVFHLRYVTTDRHRLGNLHPWASFWLIAAAEWLVCALAALWFVRRMRPPFGLDAAIIPFACATAVRYVLRREVLQDLRGLRLRPPHAVGH